MKTKYKKYPLPMEAWRNFKIKQEKISNTFKRATGKEKIIPLSKIILASSKNTLWLDDDDIKRMSKRKEGFT